MEDFLEWLHDDITWCGNECWNFTCERNLANRLSKTGPFSCSFFRGTDVCPIYRKKYENISGESLGKYEN